MNNAGIDGHFTKGHAVLIQDYLINLEPDIIIFLVEINEVGRDELHEDLFYLYSKETLNLSTTATIKNFFTSLNQYK